MEMDKSYWNEKYWVRHMKNDDLDHVEDLWVEEYESLILPHSGKLLDLGCGIGQYSEYFSGIAGGNIINSPYIHILNLSYFFNGIDHIGRLVSFFFCHGENYIICQNF